MTKTFRTAIYYDNCFTQSEFETGGKSWESKTVTFTFFIPLYFETVYTNQLVLYSLSGRLSTSSGPSQNSYLSQMDLFHCLKSPRMSLLILFHSLPCCLFLSFFQSFSFFFSSQMRIWLAVN